MWTQLWERIAITCSRLCESAWESRACWLQQLNISMLPERLLEWFLLCVSWNTQSRVTTPLFSFDLSREWGAHEWASYCHVIQWIVIQSVWTCAIVILSLFVFSTSRYMALSFLFGFKKRHVCWNVTTAISVACILENLCANISHLSVTTFLTIHLISYEMKKNITRIC